METKIAGELMIPLDEYPHIPFWFTIKEAIAMLHHSELVINGRKSLPRAVLVFDQEYKLLGMVRRRDILRGFDPDNLFGVHANYSKKLFDIEIDPNLLEVAFDKLIDTVKGKADLPVSEIMIPIEHTLDYNDHLTKIIFEIDKVKTSMIPVIKDDVIVGVVRTVEVLEEIVKILEVD